jgi:two-component system, response regulator PdtaR
MSSPHPPLILLVEDEAVVRLVAAQGLEDAGFEVIEAATAQEALEILAVRSDVGVLFTDVNMPGRLNGMDLAELVQQHWPAIKIVVTSALNLDRTMPGDGRFITKPYSLTEMTRVVTEISASPKRL